MATYATKRDSGLLVPVPTSIDAVPASTKGRYSRVEFYNEGARQGRVWLWVLPTGETSVTPYIHDLRPYGEGARNLIHSNRDNRAICIGLPIPPRGFIDFAGHPFLEEASGELYAMCDYSDMGLIGSTQIFTTTEINDNGSGITYAATTLTEGGASFTASPANGDMVGRIIRVGSAYLIVTSNTTTVLTGTDGWRDINTGLVAATPANGTAYDVPATLRDIRETTLPIHCCAGHLIRCNGKTMRLLGSNAGIATYGTTFNGIIIGSANGWSGGTNPGNDSPWQIDSLIRYRLDWVEEAA